MNANNIICPRNQKKIDVIYLTKEESQKRKNYIWPDPARFKTQEAITIIDNVNDPIILRIFIDHRDRRVRKIARAKLRRIRLSKSMEMNIKC